MPGGRAFIIHAVSEWYVSRGGQSSGPMTLAQVQQMAQSGQLGPDAYVAGPGVNGWAPAAQVPQLAPAAAPQPYPAPGAPQPQAGYAPAAPQPGYPQASGAAPQPGYPQSPMAAQAGYAPAPGSPMGGTGAVAPPGAQPAPPTPKSDWIKERLAGLGAIGIALLVLVFNVITIMTTETFFPQSLILGIGAMGYGGWVMIFGDEYDDYTLELVRWKQIGMWTCAGVGALIGLLLSGWLGS